MKIKELINEAKEKTKGIYGTIYLTNTISNLVSLLSNVIPFVGYAIISGPIKVGKNKIYNDVIDGNKPNEKEIVKPFINQWGQSFFAVIAIFLYILGTILTFEVLYLGICIESLLIESIIKELVTNYSTVTKLLYYFDYIIIVTKIIVVIIALIRIFRKVALSSLTFYILHKEEDLDGDEALRKSISLMTNHVKDYWKLFFDLFKYHLLNVFFINAYSPITSYCEYKFYSTIYNSVEIEDKEEIKEEDNKIEKTLKEIDVLSDSVEEIKQEKVDTKINIADFNEVVRNEKATNEIMYQRACDLVKNATTAVEFKLANEMFESIIDYKDSKELFEKYKEKENELRQKEEEILKQDN